MMIGGKKMAVQKLLAASSVQCKNIIGGNTVKGNAKVGNNVMARGQRAMLYLCSLRSRLGSITFSEVPLIC